MESVKITFYPAKNRLAPVPLSEFQAFVAKADNYSGSVGTINVMLDFVANHSAWDAVYGQGGVDLGFTGGTTNGIPVNWYSRTGDYGQAATYFTNLGDKDKAVAPDRNDFGKWADVAELYYGRYSAQWRFGSYTAGSEPHKNEDDFMDWNSLSPEVIKLWRYLGYYPIYWLQQTGHSLSNSTSGSATARLAADNKGIDSLRCDFGQGLPNPLWEYVINKTRSAKWNFVFMAETLDGAEPGYRSNRVFDILNESLVFNFTASHVNKEFDIQSALETRRSNYRTGAILLNITGHDEILPDNDPWLNATRYASLATVPGLPMTFYGQEQGIQNFNQTANNWHYDGFETNHELNFGKRIPHFKKWNKAQFWSQPPPNNTGMAQWYGRVNWARLNSPAIKSLNQYYLDLKIGGGAPADNIFSIAKYEQANASPAVKDVVLCFTNLFEHGASHLATSSTFDLRGGVGDPLWNLLGLKNTSARQYNVRNLASSNANANLWVTARSGSDIYSNGLPVSLGGGTANPITADGELAQFLKVVDVTAPAGAPTQVLGLTNLYAYQIGNNLSVSWAPVAADSEGIVPQYGVSVARSLVDGNVSDAGTTFSNYQTVSPSFIVTASEGVEVLVTVWAFNPNNPSSATVGPATVRFRFLSAGADQDGDGMSNDAENVAGTNPFSQSSTLKFTTSTRPSASSFNVTWASVPGKTYRVQASTTLSANSFTDISADIPASSGETTSYIDTGAGGTRKFYRVRVVP